MALISYPRYNDRVEKDFRHYWANCPQEKIDKVDQDALACFLEEGRVLPEATQYFEHNASKEIMIGSMALGVCAVNCVIYDSVSDISHAMENLPLFATTSMAGATLGSIGGMFTVFAREGLELKHCDPLVHLLALHQTLRIKRLLGTDYENVTATYNKVSLRVSAENRATEPPYRLSTKEKDQATATIIEHIMGGKARDLALAYEEDRAARPITRVGPSAREGLEKDLAKAIDPPLAAFYAEHAFLAEKQAKDKLTAKQEEEAKVIGQREADKAYAELKDEEVSQLLGYRNAQELTYFTDLSEL
jgi:hypothetical protein